MGVQGPRVEADLTITLSKVSENSPHVDALDDTFGRQTGASTGSAAASRSHPSQPLHADPQYSGLVMSANVLENVEMYTPAYRAEAMRAVGMKLVLLDGVPLQSVRHMNTLLRAWDDGVISMGFVEASIVVSETGDASVDGVYCRTRLTAEDKANQVHVKFIKLGGTAIVYYWYCGSGMWRLNTLDLTRDWVYSSVRLVGKWQKHEARDTAENPEKNMAADRYPMISVPVESCVTVTRTESRDDWQFRFSFDSPENPGVLVGCAPAYHPILEPAVGLRLVRVNKHPVYLSRGMDRRELDKYFKHDVLSLAFIQPIDKHTPPTSSRAGGGGSGGGGRDTAAAFGKGGQHHTAAAAIMQGVLSNKRRTALEATASAQESASEDGVSDGPARSHEHTDTRQHKPPQCCGVM